MKMLTVTTKTLVYQEHITGAVAILCDDIMRERLSKKDVLGFIADTVQTHGVQALSREYLERTNRTAAYRWEEAEYNASRLFPEYFEEPVPFPKAS